MWTLIEEGTDVYGFTIAVEARRLSLTSKHVQIKTTVKDTGAADIQLLLNHKISTTTVGGVQVVNIVPNP
jgi:hypothetical protein